MSWIAGLVDEMPQEWLRATASGRQLLAESRSDPGAIWRPFMALPAYRRQLEYTLLELIRVNQARSDSLGRQVRQAIADVFPAFRAREEYLTETLKLRGQPPGATPALLYQYAALEPITASAIHSWIAAQGLGPARSDLTRAEEIARALARASEEPLHIDTSWLNPTQLLTLILLAAARERGQGAVVQGERSTALSEAVNELQRMGIDIRLERRGTNRVAALLPTIALHMMDTSKLFQIEESGDSLLRSLAEVALEVTQAHAGLDGRERGKLSIEDLATALGNRWAQATGEFVSHSAADEMRPVHSSITIGPPLPLASDLARLGRKYGFLGEAIRTSEGRGARPGIAVLLGPWLTEQVGSPSDLLAINPHLAMLYLIAADTGGHAERLSRRSEMWRLDGQPLVTALDVRLRALGYEMWDERYRGQDDEVRALGSQLVEQGLRSHLLTDTGDSSSPLEAPSTYGYYDASILLASATTSRSAR